MRDLVTYINEGFKLGKNKVKKVEEDFVDLDLPSGTLWCKYNVGATCESNAKSWYGDYFMWGDPEPATNRECSWRNYKYCNGESLTKYCPDDKIDDWGGKGNPDNKLVLDLEDDMANVNMGEDWKMPSQEQFEELINNTKHIWVKNYNDIQGLNGRLFISETNDNELFMPAAGYQHALFARLVGSNVRLWSSVLSDDCPNYASNLHSNSISTFPNNHSFRNCGFPVRGVMS